MAFLRITYLILYYGTTLFYSWLMGCRSPTLPPRLGLADALSTSGRNVFCKLVWKGWQTSVTVASGACYSPRRIQYMVKETAAQAHITKHVYPHLLRHSVATTFLERGMPIEQIQKFLGHSKLETTQVYAESSTAMMRESSQRALGRGEAQRGDGGRAG